VTTTVLARQKTGTLRQVELFCRFPFNQFCHESIIQTTGTEWTLHLSSDGTRVVLRTQTVLTIETLLLRVRVRGMDW